MSASKVHPFHKLEDIDWKRVNLKKRTCGKCDQTFDTKYELLVHSPCFLQSDHYRPDQGKRYTCRKCKFATYQLSNLQDHMAQHYTGTYKCNHCMQLSHRQNELFRHLRNIHFSCMCPSRRCKKRFSSKPQMMEHVSADHPAEAYTECKSCAKITRASKMPAHEKKCRILKS